ncbi:CaiB/BaiF CoA transferase family protein [Novosphingobium piscinae]|uniref:CoA transferase n=1 Tax=Novosphingobium piscinae TaxID=1507448 RepID=A0A7X1FV53_9SPHN|nr:CoA transferase [Novosphingobium piscinae]MBC2667564.1 CoA transferase [Novosphingobium piscinae]
MSPLAGLRVLDFTHAIAGSTCTQMLLQLGAEVIKIEPPGNGDAFRHYTEHAGAPGMSVPFAALNAGKRSVVLDLKTAAGRAVALRLAARADIVAENFRPGVIDRLGLGWSALHAVNPRLVMVSLSGFGQHGPLRDWGAYDHIAQAVSGMAMMNGFDERPFKIGLPVVDSFTGYLGVIGVLAALRERDAGGTGQHIDIAMLDAALKIMGTAAAMWSYTGVAPKGTGNRGFRLVATAEYYATADGWIALGANMQHQIEALFRELGHPELGSDPRFATHADRVAHYGELKAWLTTHLLTRNAAELELRLTAAGVPAARIRDIGEALSHPHVAARGLVQPADLPGHEDPLTVLGPGFAATPPAEPLRVPALGEHTGSVLAELGLSAAEIAALDAEPSP